MEGTSKPTPPEGSPESGQALLLARGVCVSRGRTRILHDINLAGFAGEFIGVLGPSGCGKSTLLHALTGFRPPDRGTVWLCGHDVAREFQAIKHQVGFVPQDDVVPLALRVERVLHYTALLRLPHLDDQARSRRIEAVLQRLQLARQRRLRVRALSGGQRKRVSIAMELLARPPVLFADEPTSGLDPALEHGLMRTLPRIADEGKLVVVTTHVMASLSLLHQVCMLKAGRLVYFGPPGDLKSYFGVDDFADIYRVLETRNAAGWQARYAASPLFRRHLASRLQSRWAVAHTPSGRGGRRR